MYEKMNTALPDMKAYLERIGITEKQTADPDYLNKLISGHQCHIPFENIDVYHFRKRISLEIPDLFDKMVTRKRGGFCFEQNLLFLQALKSLGFHAYPVFCRILWYLENDNDLPPCTHCAIIVDMPEGPYYCDVGFGGPQPQSALPVFGGAPVKEPDALWKIVPYDYQWFTLCRKGSEEEWRSVLHFNLFRQTPQEFIAPCEFQAASDTSFFRQSLLVNLRTANGSKSITDNTYTLRDRDSVRTIELGSWEDTLKVLGEQFDLCI